MNVRLKPLTELDASATYLSWMQDETTKKYFPNLSKIKTIHSLKDSIKCLNDDKKISIYKIVLDNLHVGNIQLREIHANTLLLSILIGDKQHRGMGIGKKAIQLLIESLGHNREHIILAQVKKCNVTSQKLFASLNFNISEFNDMSLDIRKQLKSQELIFIKGYKQ